MIDVSRVMKAEQINNHHRTCERAADSMLSAAILTGKTLCDVERSMPPEEWKTWLEEHFEGDERTARTYMRVARGQATLRDAKSVSHLALSGALRVVSSRLEL